MDVTAQLNAALAGRYTIEREIGRGGMATVYLARDVRHRRAVALKVLNPELGAVLGVERFLAEIQVTAGLQHPNLLPLFDSGEADGMLFYVMPFVAGESLRQCLDREKQLPVNEAIRIASAVASALDYAHRHDVIHRDLKPENILLHEGQPLVADFGIALAVSNAGGSRITQTGISLGTPRYMSPEQAAGDRAIDGRTDVYSLGTVLYEMLTGDPPFQGSTSQAIIARVLTEKPRSVRLSRETVPLYVDAAIDKALAKLPADRWSSAQEFAQALAGERAISMRAPALSDAGSEPSTRLGISSPRMRRTAVLLLPLLGFGLGATVATWVGRHRERNEFPVRFAVTFPPDERPLNGAGSPLAISPDGKLLVFIGSRGADEPKLYIRPLGDLRSRELPGTERGQQPFFSRDGRWVGFIVRNELRKVPLDGGSSVAIADAAVPAGAAWGADDQIVVSTRGTLAVVSALGGPVRRVATPDTGAGTVEYRWPHFLPDGKTVVFSAWNRTGLTVTHIGVMSLTNGRTKILDLVGTDPITVIEGRLIYATAAGEIMAAPFSTRDQRLIGTPVPVIDNAFVGGGGPLKGDVSASGSLVYMAGGSAQQVVLSDGRHEPRVLVQQAGHYQFPRLSPDGRRLALAVVSGAGTQIHIFDLTSGTLTQLTTEGSINDRPEWTPDGTQVLFTSDRDGSPSLWWQPADRSAPARVLFHSDSLDVADGILSPDGRRLIVRVTGKNRNVQFLYRETTGDTTPKPLVTSTFSVEGPRVSPNGEWLAFASTESGIFEVYVSPFPGSGARYQVSVDGGSEPVWAPDGRRLYYVVRGQLMSATLSFSPAFNVTAREKLADVHSTMALHASYDVTPDGKQFVLLKPVGAADQIVVVHDWKSELRTRAPMTNTR